MKTKEEFLNQLQKGNLLNSISPEELPDQAPEGLPIPWRKEEVGNGNMYLYTADNEFFAHVNWWYEHELELLEQKLNSINTGS